MSHDDEKIEDDILEKKEDSLRATRKTPHNEKQDNKSVNNAGLPDNPEKKHTKNTPLEPSPMMKAVVDANKKNDANRQTSEVPRFDIARKILSQQRKTSAARRTAPVKSQVNEPPALQRIHTRKERIDYTRPGYKNLIAEIVAKDIDRLSRDQSLIG